MTTDSGVHGSSKEPAIVKRHSSRLRRVQPPIGEVSFDSISTSTKGGMDSLFTFDFFVGISHILLVSFCGMFGELDVVHSYPPSLQPMSSGLPPTRSNSEVTMKSRKKLGI
jgi:hypothetical protein